MKLFIILSFSLVSFECLSQQSTKKYSFDGTFAAAYSRFRVKEFNTDNYPTLELRMGAIGTLRVAPRWALRSGINFAIKFKRKSYVTHGYLYHGKGFLNKRIDETASLENHHTFEVPLSLVFYHSDRLSFNGGVMARFWGPTDLNTDILASQAELGFLIGGQREFSRKVGVGMDFYSTLAPVLAFGTKNQFLQLKLVYHLDR